MRCVSLSITYHSFNSLICFSNCSFTFSVESSEEVLPEESSVEPVESSSVLPVEPSEEEQSSVAPVESSEEKEEL